MGPGARRGGQRRSSRGGLVVLPTDTVYGIAADAFTPPAVAALLAAKGRGPPDAAARADPRRAHARRPAHRRARRARARWSRRSGPAGSRSSCRAQPSLAWDLGETRGTVALRMPDHPAALALLRRTGPLAVSSANRTGPPAARHRRRTRTTSSATPSRSTSTAGDAPGRVASTIVDATGPTCCGSCAPARSSLEAAARGRRRASEAAATPREGLPARCCSSPRRSTYLTTPLARWLALRSGAITAVRDRDVHAIPTPAAGRRGDVRWAWPSRSSWPRQMPFLEGVFANSRPLVGDPRAAPRSCALLGVADDIWDLDWLTKLIGQVLAGGFLAWQGVQLVPAADRRAADRSGPPGCRSFLTVLTVVVAMNAVNFVDGLDGLAAGLHRDRRHGVLRLHLPAHRAAPARGDYSQPRERS